MGGTLPLLRRAKELAEQVKAAEADEVEAEAAFTAAHLAISNVIVDGVPAGGRTTTRRSTSSASPATSRTYLELGESLGPRSTWKRAAKVLGSRPYFLTGRGVPYLIAAAGAEASRRQRLCPLRSRRCWVRPEVMVGTGFLGAHAEEVPGRGRRPLLLWHLRGRYNTPARF